MADTQALSDFEPTALVQQEHTQSVNLVETSPHSRFQRVLFLGSEFNATKGDHRTMDITQEALRGGVRSEEPYFRIIKAQLQSLRINGSVYFDDVSIVPATGQQNSSEVYNEKCEAFQMVSSTFAQYLSP